MQRVIKILSREEIEDGLKKLPGWKHKGGRIEKTFEFKEFMDLVNFVSDLAPFCEKLDHHPDMIIEHRNITFKLWRFDIGMKITNFDFIMAQKIEELIKKYNLRS